jgi:hypothetical protein
MASTTYEHFVDVNKMCAAREQFRHITKMVCACFRGITKTYHFAVLGTMVRNAGQLPDIAAQTHYSRTAVGYRLKGIEKMLDV